VAGGVSTIIRLPAALSVRERASGVVSRAFRGAEGRSEGRDHPNAELGEG